MKKAKRWILFAAILTVGLPGSTVASNAPDQGRGRGRGGSASDVVVFRESDRATFHDYFVAHEITAKPLPPGIAKNVARGKPLPPGIAKRALPTDLLALAPKVDKDVSFAIVGEVVVAIKGGIVIDVLAGVFQ